MSELGNFASFDPNRFEEARKRDLREKGIPYYAPNNLPDARRADLEVKGIDSENMPSGNGRMMDLQQHAKSLASHEDATIVGGVAAFFEPDHDLREIARLEIERDLEWTGTHLEEINQQLQIEL